MNKKRIPGSALIALAVVYACLIPNTSQSSPFGDEKWDIVRIEHAGGAVIQKTDNGSLSSHMPGVRSILLEIPKSMINRVLRIFGSTDLGDPGPAIAENEGTWAWPWSIVILLGILGGLFLLLKSKKNKMTKSARLLKPEPEFDAPIQPSREPKKKKEMMQPSLLKTRNLIKAG